MGKKTERIAELEDLLKSYRSIDDANIALRTIRSLHDHIRLVEGDLGIQDLSDLADLADPQQTFQRIRLRISALHQRAQVAGPVSAAWQASVDVSTESSAMTGGALATFDKLVDGEVDRINQSSAGPTLRGVPEGVAKRILGIAHELELDVQWDDPVADGLDSIHKALLGLKGGGGIVEVEGTTTAGKGDSLAESVRHNSTMRLELETELTRTRNIVSRVAAAMQVSQWDKDGTEIVERVQRWDSLKHLLRRSIKSWRERGEATVADELQAILAKLISSRDLAKWLENKPAAVVTGNVVDLATNEAWLLTSPFHKVVPGDVARLHRMVECYRQSGEPWTSLDSWMFEIMGAMAKSAEASGEFINLMNLVVLPILARQAAATNRATD